MTKLQSKSITSLKQDAKCLAKSKNLTHLQALDLIAKQQGFSTWSLLSHQMCEGTVVSIQDLLQLLFRPTLLLLSADKNVGKSTLAINLTLTCINKGKHIHYISTHLSKSVFKQRLLSIHSGCSQQSLSSPVYDATPKAIEAAVKSFTLFEQPHCHFLYDQALTYSTLIQYIKQHGSPDTIFIIDYIEAIKASETKLLFELKNESKSTLSGILCLSQMNKHDKRFTRHCDYAFKLTRNEEDATITTLKSPNHRQSEICLSYDPPIGLFK